MSKEQVLAIGLSLKNRNKKELDELFSQKVQDELGIDIVEANILIREVKNDYGFYYGKETWAEPSKTVSGANLVNGYKYLSSKQQEEEEMEEEQMVFDGAISKDFEELKKSAELASQRKELADIEKKRATKLAKMAERRLIYLQVQMQMEQARLMSIDIPDTVFYCVDYGEGVTAISKKDYKSFQSDLGASADIFYGIFVNGEKTTD